MALDLDDGYTLSAATLPAYRAATALPVVVFKYRPALVSELSRWRYDMSRATSADAELAASTKLLTDHLVSWDVANKGIPAVINHENIKRLPEGVFEQLLEAITRWAPKEQAKTEGN